MFGDFQYIISEPNQSEDDGDSSDGSARDEGGGKRPAHDDANIDFWVPNDIPVEPNITLESGACCILDDFVKPPADLLLLEGDCLDANGEGGELDSYLLAKCELYKDFILLDPSDAAAIDEYLKENQEPEVKQNGVSRGSSQRSHKSFLSPTKEKGGSALKSPNAHFDQSPGLDHGFDFIDFNNNVPQNNNSEFEMEGGGYPGSEDDDDSDEDDLWKPLNPHEPGNLKVKPFKEVKANRWDGSKPSKRTSVTKEFPLAPFHGPISSDIAHVWESRRHPSGSQQSKYPLYEKLRQSLVLGEHDTFDEYKSKAVDEDNGYDSEDDYSGPEFDMPENTFMNEDVAYMNEDNNNGGAPFHTDTASGNDDPTPDANLEDLCHKHLDSLVPNLKEIEEQNEMAVRVSTWKDRIEQSLEEQDALPPFDIHTYGEKLLEKLSVENEGEKTMSFTDVVKGQEKHDVARTFCAMLQLVNNGNIDLLRVEDNGDKEDNQDKERKCYTAKKPFYIKLLRHKRRQEVQLRSSKKAKSPATNTKASKGKGKSAKKKH
ncbi:condensin-2 complex subunit H2 isoform X2 [Daucus carota subsp. sativus]|uniref:condensin-2 complex subunit H2 isoform X2 n=1 Tax=Daucus carota subsp. sativus TaxID=79200 RepID=UPI0007EF43F6|nr:PREDICTED: condensin-2 complex subunit H2 isoform X2 [Daucus carota subsp. sativus]